MLAIYASYSYVPLLAIHLENKTAIRTFEFSFYIILGVNIKYLHTFLYLYGHINVLMAFKELNLKPAKY